MVGLAFWANILYIYAGDEHADRYRGVQLAQSKWNIIILYGLSQFYTSHVTGTLTIRHRQTMEHQTHVLRARSRDMRESRDIDGIICNRPFTVLHLGFGHLTKQCGARSCTARCLVCTDTTAVPTYITMIAIFERRPKEILYMWFSGPLEHSADELSLSLVHLIGTKFNKLPIFNLSSVKRHLLHLSNPDSKLNTHHPSNMTNPPTKPPTWLTLSFSESPQRMDRYN